MLQIAALLCALCMSMDVHSSSHNMPRNLHARRPNTKLEYPKVAVLAIKAQSVVPTSLTLI